MCNSPKVELVAPTSSATKSAFLCNTQGKDFGGLAFVRLRGLPPIPPEGDLPPHSHTKKRLFYFLRLPFSCMLLRGVTNATHYISSQKWEMLLYIVKIFFAPQKKCVYKNTPPTPPLTGRGGCGGCGGLGGLGGIGGLGGCGGRMADSFLNLII